MQNDLIIMTFYSEREANKVFNSLKEMRRSQVLGIDHASIVIKDKTGKVWLHQKHEISQQKKHKEDEVLRFLTNLIFNTFLAENVKKLAKVGLDESFIDDVLQMMKEDSSALLFFIPQEGLADKDELIKALNLFWGKIHQTTLSKEVESAILEELGNEALDG